MASILEKTGEKKQPDTFEKSAKVAVSDENQHDSILLPWFIFLSSNIVALFILYYFWFSHSAEQLTSELSTPFSAHLFLSCALLILMTTSLTAAPLIRFVMIGWKARHHEFLNRLNGDALTAYLQQFWEKHTRSERFGFIAWTSSNEDEKNKIRQTMEMAFDAIYKEQYGRTAFFIPIVLLISIIFMSIVLSILLYLDIIHISPTFDISSNVAIASIAGAYLYVVSNIIQSVRQRSLNTSDIYWYVLRMLLAIPIGFALTSPIINTGIDSVKPFVAFGLGTLPMDQIIRVLRQATNKLLNLSEEIEKSDHLIQLEGVTSRVASILNAEGVDSIEQIITVDPVLLSIRTGLPFKFILQLGSQAIVRRYLGATAEKLIPLSLTNAESITALVVELKNDTSRATAVLNAATAQIKSNEFKTPANVDATVAVSVASTVTEADLTESLKFIFYQIADANYSKFILGDLLTM